MEVVHHLVVLQWEDSSRNPVLLEELRVVVDLKVLQVRMQVHLDMEPQNLFG